MSKMGRPAFIVTNEVLDEIEKFASRQLTDGQIAACLNLHESTFTRKKAENPEIQKRIDMGKQKGISALVNKLYEKAMSGSEKSLIFFLKCRAGFKEDSYDGMAVVPIRFKVGDKDVEIS